MISTTLAIGLVGLLVARLAWLYRSDSIIFRIAWVIATAAGIFFLAKWLVYEASLL